VAPTLILFLYFKILPLAQGVQMSFYDVRPYLGDRYVGGGNYVEATTQPLFTQAIWQTIILAVGTTAGSILLGFLLAILVEGQARHLWLVRTAAFLPVVTTMAVVAEVWQVMYYPDRSGALNTILGWIGVAVTGSDTSSNALFGALQVQTAARAHLDPVLLAAANSSGGVMGKMISPQNLAIAAAAVGMAGREGDIFRKVFGWSLVLLLLMCVLVYLQSTAVLSWMVPGG